MLHFALPRQHPFAKLFDEKYEEMERLSFRFYGHEMGGKKSQYKCKTQKHNAAGSVLLNFFFSFEQTNPKLQHA